MNKLQKLLNMIFNGEEYDDMKGWQRALEIIFYPWFLLLQAPFQTNSESNKAEFLVLAAIILLGLIGIIYLLI